MEPIELGPCIGVGRVAEVFDAGENVLKLYRLEADKASAFREAAVLAILDNLDLPSPSVSSVQRYGDRWGITMSKAAGPSFAEQMFGTEDGGAYLRHMAALHALVHGNPGVRLPSQSQRLRYNIETAPLLLASARKRLLEALAEREGGDRLCHGDFHPLNIIGRPGEAIIVDWLDACQGSPQADLCRSYVLMCSFDPDLARRYVDVYAELTEMAAGEVYQWLPLVAAARLSEHVPEENDRLLSLAEAI